MGNAQLDRWHTEATVASALDEDLPQIESK
jgi:hypothetical protein